jgi:hypothetical protein
LPKDDRGYVKKCCFEPQRYCRSIEYRQSLTQQYL